MIALLVIILLVLLMNTAILLIHIDTEEPEREVHPIAIEAVRAELKTVKPFVRRQWSEDTPAKDAN